MSEIVNTINDRDLAHLAALAAGPMAASVVQQTLPKAPIVDTVESVHPKVGAVEGRPLPRLTRPEPLDQETYVQGKEDLKQLLPTNDQNQVVGDVDDLFHQLLLNVINSASGYLQAKRNYFEAERLWNDKMEQKRIEEVDNELAKSKEVSLWEKVEKSLLSFGLIAGGIGGICSGLFALGIPAVALGTLMLIDQILDDKIKKTVASWMARGDAEGKQQWLNRIGLFLTFTSFGLSCGLAGIQALDFAKTFASALASGTKEVLNYQLNLRKAVVVGLDAACRSGQTTVDRLIQQIHEACNTLYQFHENISHVSEQRRKLINSFMQFR